MSGNTDHTATLNRLLNLERFSLANYLQYARPVVRPGDEALREAVGQIARDQAECARRIAGAITRRKAGVQPSRGFPAKYTAYNDLDIRYLLGRLLEDEERIVREVWECLGELRGDPEAEGLAAEVLDSEQAHLKELVALRGTARPIPAAGLARAA
ncbi:MAG TPA: ferritin-like domain-containing protein [Gemmataceae bacterium]|nr:ferritin-like domain-containing protein [Gemmataceae bacterium]